MILVDTSIWVDHLRVGEPALQRALEQGLVLSHPWVIGELALGQLKQRQEVLGLLAGLPVAAVVTASEVATFVDRYKLMGRGIGYVDVQLLASTQLTVDARLWTRDTRLASCARELGLSVDPSVLSET